MKTRSIFTTHSNTVSKINKTRGISVFSGYLFTAKTQDKTEFSGRLVDFQPVRVEGENVTYVELHYKELTPHAQRGYQDAQELSTLRLGPYESVSYIQTKAEHVSPFPEDTAEDLLGFLEAMKKSTIVLSGKKEKVLLRFLLPENR